MTRLPTWREVEEFRVRYRLDDPLDALMTSQPANEAVVRLGRDMGVRTIAELATFDRTRFSELDGIDSADVLGLEALQDQARTIFSVLVLQQPPPASLDIGTLDEALLTMYLFHGARTVQDALDLAPGLDLDHDLDFDSIVNAYGRTATKMTALQSLTPALSAILMPLSLIRNTLEDIEPRSRLALLQTELAPHGDKKTLENIGKELGVTRERVRQLARRGRWHFDAQTAHILSALGRILVAHAGDICRRTTIERLLAPVLRTDDIDLLNTARRAILRMAGYRSSRDGWLIEKRVVDKPKAIKKACVHGSRLRGIVPAALIESACAGLFMSMAEREAFLAHKLGFVRFHGHWLPNKSKRWRTLAALTILGKPATKHEISAIGDLPVRNLTWVLNGFDNVIQLEDGRWALIDWV